MLNKLLHTASSSSLFNMSSSKALISIESSEDLPTVISSFEERILEAAGYASLPVEGVVADQRSRLTILQNFGLLMEALPLEKRSSAVYLSKFMVAVGAGLFDAALNYLWDETIGELRRRIVDYDLQYFFDQAATDPSKRKDLNDAEDLEKITDDELIRAAAKVGFISDLGLHQLDLVREMRNHASAAHPNQHDLTPFVLLGYLETCIKEVITLPESHTMIETNTLLRNVKTATVSEEEFNKYKDLLEGVRIEQLEALARGLFGIYVRPESSSKSRENVRVLFPWVWSGLDEKTRFSYGIRYARFRANLDEEQAKYARELLENVGASSYLPADVRGAEIDEILDQLISVHNARDNFYNEPPLAKKLDEYVGVQSVPMGVSDKYVEVIIELFLGRPSGIAWNANDIYRGLIDRFSSEQATFGLHFMTGVTLSALLTVPSPRNQFDELMDALEPKLVSRSAKSLLKEVRGFSGGHEKIYKDTNISAHRKSLEPNIASR